MQEAALFQSYLDRTAASQSWKHSSEGAGIAPGCHSPLQLLLEHRMQAEALLLVFPATPCSTCQTSGLTRHQPPLR